GEIEDDLETEGTEQESQGQGGQDNLDEQPEGSKSGRNKGGVTVNLAVDSSTTFSVSRRLVRKCQRYWAACPAPYATSPTWRRKWANCKSASRPPRRDRS